MSSDIVVLVLTMMLQQFWIRYSSNPVRSVVKTFYRSIYEAPFPALTICPLIPPMSSRRRKVFESIIIPRNMTNSTAKFLIRYGPAFANENAPGGQSHVDEMKLLLETNNMTLIDLIKALRPCEDLFETCFWETHVRNCSELFKVSYTFTGICCSFNYLLEDFIKTGRTRNFNKLRTTLYYGPRSGLKVVLHRNFLFEDDDPEQKYIKYSTNSVGLVMFPHHPLEYVATMAPRHILQAEQELQISVTPVVNSKLSGYYRDSHTGKMTPNCADVKAKLKYFPTYRYSNCFTSCSINATLNICGCLPYYYTPITIKHSIKLCDWEDFPCLWKNANKTRIITNMVTENFTCECITPCWNVMYHLRTSTLPLNGAHEFNPPIYKNLSKAQSVLSVFMRSSTFMETETIPVADELYLLCALGGVFNLFLGCSFISVLEIFYFIGIYLCSAVKKSK
ncbi:PREDICTED: sodium channel protein Nach [Wasmannia auropunctata]|uniref:sodium channel protein Nach n=1 Tax=Wasmannia auropunctata TaxID=64793 RepID=UPI0005EFBEDD|nr:PREDICTED: sodium channel protein Nach [Wasmannia auropunctata]